MWVPAGRFRLQIIRVNRSDLYRIHNADHGVLLRGCYGAFICSACAIVSITQKPGTTPVAELLRVHGPLPPLQIVHTVRVWE